MESILPPHLEAKRLMIARTHNRLVIGVLIGIAASALAAVLLLPQDLPIPSRIVYFMCVLGFVVAPLEFYALFRILRHDKALSRQLAFVCPHCLQPLYEPRGFINRTGCCPKCKKSVVT
jgi:hypothetical protein